LSEDRSNLWNFLLGSELQGVSCQTGQKETAYSASERAATILYKVPEYSVIAIFVYSVSGIYD